MRKYKSVYPWNVLDEIEAGKKIQLLDKEVGAVIVVNDLPVWNALKWIAAAKESMDRFEFWYVEEQEDEGNDQEL